MYSFRITRAIIALVATAVTALALAAGAQGATSTIMYGPYTIPAGSGDPHDHAGMGHVENQINTSIAKPCSGCTLTRMQANLVYADGSTANWNTGAMLHHTLQIALGRNDTTCGSQFRGERFFASGNERTPADLNGSGYGYKVGSEEWAMVTHLANWSTNSQSVYVTITYDYQTGTASNALGGVRPLWLDEVPCSTSEFSIPAGVSHTIRDWKATVNGDIIAAAGHLHDHGVDVTATNRTRNNSLICRSVASFGGTGYTTPDGRNHISGMSTCGGSPLHSFRKRDVIRLDAQYNVPAGHGAIDDAMGIMLAYYVPR